MIYRTNKNDSLSETKKIQVNKYLIKKIVED